MRQPRITRVLALAGAVLGAVGLQWWMWAEARWLTALSFGGDERRVLVISARYGEGDSFATELWITLAILAVAVSLTAWALLQWWDYGWRSAAQRRVRVAMGMLPLVALAAGAAETVIAQFAVTQEGNRLEVDDLWAAVMAALGQLKWLVLMVCGFALFLTVYGAVRFRRLSFDPGPPTEEIVHGPPVDLPVEGSAICISGGGIRSGAFAWGALAELEQHRPLSAFDHMYSVSGGGYTACAYTNAPDELRLAPTFFGAAQIPHPESTAADALRYEYVRERQQFLSTGPGGVIRALMLAFAAIGLNLFVIFLGVVVVSVPVGVLAQSNLGGGRIHGAKGATEITSGLVRPVLVLLVLALAALFLAAAFDNGRRRYGLTTCIGLLAAAGAIAVIRLLLPWLAGNLGSVVSVDWWKGVIPAALLWVGALVFGVMRARLRKSAIRLGGLIVLAAIVFAAAMVTRLTVEEDAYWLANKSFLDNPLWLLLLTGALLIAIDYSGAEWWSLHPIYRNRLANAFVFENGDKGLVAQARTAWPTFHDVHQREHSKPQHVVCACTHRDDTAVTGLTSLSFTFSSDGIDMIEPTWDGVTGTVTVRRYHRDAEWLEHAIGGHRAYFRTRKRATVMSAVTVSGAAFDPSMGRLSKGSTDSLLAMLNLRLGLWLPNPRYESGPTAAGRPTTAFTRPGLRYLFHEVIRHYETSDPFVHVTDGGHWENLGLVEALRARHAHIVLIDASGDHFTMTGPGGAVAGLSTLHQAMDLARIELHTEVRIDPDQFTAMVPDVRTGRCQRNWMTCEIVYHSDPNHDWRTGCTDLCRTGQLLMVKALISDRTPESVLSFANTDRIFPEYSTGDQFLSDEQFRSLVGLGQSAMGEALHIEGDDWFDRRVS